MFICILQLISKAVIFYLAVSAFNKHVNQIPIGYAAVAFAYCFDMAAAVNRKLYTLGNVIFCLLFSW